MPAPTATPAHPSYGPSQPPTQGSSSASHPAAQYEDAVRFRSYVSKINFNFDAEEELFAQRTEVPYPCPSRVVPPEELRRRAQDYAPRRGTGLGKMGGNGPWERFDSGHDYDSDDDGNENDGESEMEVEYEDEDEEMADDERDDEDSDEHDDFDNDADGSGGNNGDDDGMPSVNHQAYYLRNQMTNNRLTQGLIQPSNSKGESESSELSSVMDFDSDESDSHACIVVAPRRSPHQPAGSTQINPVEIESDSAENDDTTPEANLSGKIARVTSPDRNRVPDMSFLRFLKRSVDRSQPGPTKLKKLTPPNDNDQNAMPLSRSGPNARRKKDAPARKIGFDRVFLKFLASRLGRPPVALNRNERFIVYQEDGLKAIPGRTPVAHVDRNNGEDNGRDDDGGVAFNSKRNASKEPNRSNDQNYLEGSTAPEGGEDNEENDGSKNDGEAEYVQDAHDEQMNTDSCSEWGLESENDMDDEDDD